MAPGIGERIKEYRLEAGMNLTELATEAGITKGYLWQLEEGDTKNPTLDTLIKIAEALDKTVSELIYGEPLTKPTEGQIPAIPPSLQEFINAQNEKGGLSPDDIRVLASIHYRGQRPKTAEDWQTLYGVIKSVSKKK